MSFEGDKRTRTLEILININFTIYSFYVKHSIEFI